MIQIPILKKEIKTKKKRKESKERKSIIQKEKNPMIKVMKALVQIEVKVMKIRSLKKKEIKRTLKLLKKKLRKQKKIKIVQIQILILNLKRNINKKESIGFLKDQKKKIPPLLLYLLKDLNPV